MKIKSFKCSTFRVSKFRSFKFWNFQSFKDAHISFMLQVSIPYPIFARTDQIYLRELSALILSNTLKIFYVRHFWDFQLYHLSNLNQYSPWILWNNSVSPKSEIFGLGSHGHVRQVRKSWKLWVVGFFQNEDEQVLAQNEIYDKNSPPIPPRPQNRILPGCTVCWGVGGPLSRITT